MRSILSFSGICIENAKDCPALYKGYLADGSLELVVEPKEGDMLIYDWYPDQEDCKEPAQDPEPDADPDLKPI